MAKIINLGCVTKLNLPAERVLGAAIGETTGVVVMGYDNEGGFYFSSSFADGGEVLWLMENCKKALLSGSFDDDV